MRVEDTESDASSVAGGDDNGRAMVADQDAPIKMWSLIQPFFTRPSPASWQALMFQTPPPIGEVPPELQYIVNRQSMPVTTAASPASSTPALPTVSTSTSPMNSAGTPRPPQVQFPSLSTAAASISGVREDKFEIQRELLRSKVRSHACLVVSDWSAV